MIPKFRAWDKTTNQMRGCYGFNELEREVYVCSVADDEFNGRLKTVHAIRRSFDEVVVMQSTGLKDKNYVEIYEGDIVVNHVGDVWVISYFRGAFRYYPIESYSKDKEKPFETDSIGNFGTETFEVIGNIYESPEWRINYV